MAYHQNLGGTLLG